MIFLSLNTPPVISFTLRSFHEGLLSGLTKATEDAKIPSCIVTLASATLPFRNSII